MHWQNFPSFIIRQVWARLYGQPSDFSVFQSTSSFAVLCVMGCLSFERQLHEATRETTSGRAKCSRYTERFKMHIVHYGALFAGM